MQACKFAAVQRRCNAASCLLQCRHRRCIRDAQAGWSPKGVARHKRHAGCFDQVPAVGRDQRSARSCGPDRAVLLIVFEEMAPVSRVGQAVYSYAADQRPYTCRGHQHLARRQSRWPGHLAQQKRTHLASCRRHRLGLAAARLECLTAPYAENSAAPAKNHPHVSGARDVRSHAVTKELPQSAPMYEPVSPCQGDPHVPGVRNQNSRIACCTWKAATICCTGWPPPFPSANAVSAACCAMLLAPAADDLAESCVHC